MPQLANAELAAKNQGGGCAGSFGVGAGDQTATFHLQNVTVRDILDRFVTSAGFNIWMATFPEIKSTTPKGFFKSISIFSRDLPDADLPAWDLLYPAGNLWAVSLKRLWRATFTPHHLKASGTKNKEVSPSPRGLLEFAEQLLVRCQRFSSRASRP